MNWKKRFRKYFQQKVISDDVIGASWKKMLKDRSNAVLRRIDSSEKLEMCIKSPIFTHQKAGKMRTNIVIDEELIQQALKLSNTKTKKEVVEQALKNYVAYLKRRQLLSLKGKVVWEGNLKQMRSI